MTFHFSLHAPNQWAGVTVEIHGQPDTDGWFVPDDVSGFKDPSMQVSAMGSIFCGSRPSASRKGRTRGRLDQCDANKLGMILVDNVVFEE